MARQILFDHALLPSGWAQDVLIKIAEGKIVEVQPNATVSQSMSVKHISGLVTPGIANVHSHAFQRAFAGMSEYRSGDNDSFWTWRRQMYDMVERLTPSEMYLIGHKAYTEMLAAGYTSVGEFHYVHHQQGGQPYENLCEMADALLLAATDVGIGITMLPAYYQRGGFDDSPLEGGQKRFGSSQERFLDMMHKLKRDWAGAPNVRIGVALHSLRAVSIPAAREMLKQVDQFLPGCPIHIHVAEQTQEVDDCLAANGKRPVELLLDNFEVNERWCLIHATHMTSEECRRVAESGAVVGLCPTTEANLGDGVFMAERFVQQGGRFAIGSDSNVCIDPYEELRLLEYTQRLMHRRRAILCTQRESCGQFLYRNSADGGAIALGLHDNGIALDKEGMLVTMLPKKLGASPAIEGTPIDAMMFSPNRLTTERFDMGQGFECPNDGSA